MTQNIKPEDLPEGLVEKIRKVRVDDIRKSLDEKLYGILLGDKDFLKYWTPEKTYTLTETKESIFGVDIYNEKIVYGGQDSQITILPDRTVKKRINYVSGFLTLNGNLYDHGLYGLADTKTDQMIINHDELRKHNNIQQINSCFLYEDAIYALGATRGYEYHLFKINIDNEFPSSIGKPIKSYSKGTTYLAQALPTSNGIISTIYENYLCIDNIILDKTRQEKNKSILRVALLESTENKTCVVYSGSMIGAVMRAEIDHSKNHTKIRPLITNLSNYISTLRPVTTQKDHNTVLKIIS